MSSRWFGNQPSAVVHEADIAAVAVAALTQDGHGGRTYLVSGPEALTTEERIKLLAKACGNPVGVEFLTEEQQRARLAAQGWDQEYVEFAIMLGDISAPVTMNRGMFGWAPTVQLTTYLRRLPEPGWMRVMASAQVLGDTWFEEDHLVLDSSGQVIVQSRQLAMIPKG